MATSVRARYCVELVTKVAEFLCRKEFCDVDVVVGEKRFKCHRLILSASSEYFKIMFSGQYKESSAKEITLPAADADVFETILEFVYTGSASINLSNLYRTISAADFYKIPLMIELCTQFVEENLNALAGDILEIYTLAHCVGLTKLFDLLSAHILSNFAYFSRRPEFFNLTFDSLIAFWDLIERLLPVGHDVYLEGIYRWITHQENTTVEQRESYANELVKRIDFTKISIEYAQFRMKRYMKELVQGKRIGDDDLVPADDVQWPVKLLGAYVSVDSGDGFSLGTFIFTASLTGPDVCATRPHVKWVYSGQSALSIDFMRNVDIGDDRLYSLRYSNRRTDYHYPQQTFVVGTSMSMYPHLCLRSPPYILDEFDMCGTKNDIYVYNKNAPIYPSTTVKSYRDAGFGEEELSGGLYVYRRDADRWFPLPRPRDRFANACLTCDDQVLYLIGGANSNSTVQMYDPRTRAWSALPPTIGEYDGAACCAYEKKIYVVGGALNSHTVEMYDPTSGSWQLFRELEKSRTNKHELVNWCPQFGDEHRLVSFNRTLTPDSTILCSGPGDDMVNEEWSSMPNLFSAVRQSCPFFTNNLSILDMVDF